MYVRGCGRAVVVPTVLMLAAGTGLASVPATATAESRPSQHGKVVPGQWGASASSVASVRTWGDNTLGQIGNGTPWRPTL